MEGNNNFNQNQYEANQTNNFNQEPIYQSNQVLEKKEGSNKILVVALVMSFIAVIALAYFYTDIKNEYIALKAEQINNPSSCVKPEEDAAKKEVKVEELTHIATEKDDKGRQYADIKIPKLTGNTDVIGKINNKIISDSYEKVLNASAYDEWISSAESNYYKGDYKFVIKNDIIIIVTTIENFKTYFGKLEPERKIYTYDISNDKEITLSDALVKIGYTDEDFLELAQNKKCYDKNDEMVPCTIDVVKKIINWIKDGDISQNEYSNSSFMIDDNNEIKIEMSFDQKY